MTCDRCGRLLNRATGRCICEDYEGGAPPPVAMTHPPPEALESPPEAVQPLSKASVMSMLDMGTRPPPPAVAPPKPPPEPVEPPPPPRAPGEALGVLRSVRFGRRSVDVVVYDTSIVLARRGAPANLMAGQLAAQDSSARVIDEQAVGDVAVREDRFSSRVTIRVRNGEELSFGWLGHKNRGLSAENLLAGVFSGRVDQAPSAVAERAGKAFAVLGGLIVVGVGATFGLSKLLEEGPPPPPPPPPTTTLPAAEQAARGELQAVCGTWMSFASAIPAGDRPDPVALRPIVDGLKPRFDAAAAVKDYEAARDEVAYLQDYARRPPDAIARESSSRVGFALTTISSACTRAGGAPPP